VLQKKTLSAGQMSTFELLMPIIRRIEHLPFHSHNSVIGVGRKPE
jgi:hypothetical protein